MADLRIPSSLPVPAAAPAQGVAVRDAQRAFFAAALKSPNAPVPQSAAVATPRVGATKAGSSAVQTAAPSGGQFARPGSRLDIRV
jgi:hypothetical protein